MHSWRLLLQVRLGPGDAGHKQLGYGMATSHMLQLALVLLTGTLSMLEACRHQLPLHGRAVAASFGIVYALQAGNPALFSMAIYLQGVLAQQPGHCQAWAFCMNGYACSMIELEGGQAEMTCKN